MPQGLSRIRITVEDDRRQRITTICGKTLEETRYIVGEKLGMPDPASCRLFNKYGAEIDDLDLLGDNDLVYASLGASRSLPRRALGSLMHEQPASTITPSAASTIAGDGDGAHSGAKGNDFEIGKVLGIGGQGTTFLTTDKRTGCKAVLKHIYCPGLAETNKAIVEAVMLSRLKHPRVVSYNEVFLGSDPVKGNYVGIVMEYCAGGDLFQMLCKQRAKKNKPISQRRVKMWIVQLCEALAYLHSQEVIHRDVKPMNVLLEASGDVKIADFGLARYGVTGSRPAMTQCGTPGYESPEVQLGRGSDAKTDIWGLGCVLCDVMTLKFMHERPGSLATQVQVDPTALSKLLGPVMELYGRDLHALLSSMLSADPAARPSAREILTYTFLHPIIPSDREPALAQGPGSSPPDAVPPAPPSPPPMVPKARPHDASNAQLHQAPSMRRDPALHTYDESNSSPMASPVRRVRSMPPQKATPPANMGSGGRTKEKTKESRQSAPPLSQECSSTASNSLQELEGFASRMDLAGHGGGILVVSKRPERHEYGSVCEAVRWARPGSIIEVLDGIYQEEIVMDKELTLRAASGAKVEVHSISRRPVLTCSVAGNGSCTVMGIKLMHFSKQQREGKSCTRALDICAGKLVLEECEVTSVCGVGVVVRDGARLEARRSRVVRCGQNGVFVFDGGSGIIEDCELADNTFPGLGLDKCDDFKLTNSRVCNGKGDGVKIRGGGEGVQLLNNDISHNGQVGVSVEEEACPIIRGNKVRDGSSCGISMMTNSRGIIEENEIFGNTHPNVYIATGADPQVRRNEIYHSQSCGITVVEKGLGLFEENDVYSNQSVGVYVVTGASPIMRGNTVRDGDGDGIAVCFGGRGIFERNRILGNKGVGILLENEAEPKVIENIISDTTGDSMRISVNSKGVIERNTIERGRQCGMAITQGAFPVVKGNTIVECGGCGIIVFEEAGGHIERNTVRGHGSHGIVVTRRANPTVRANIVKDNEGAGIWLGQAGHGTIEANRVLGNKGQNQICVTSGCDAIVRDNVCA